LNDVNKLFLDEVHQTHGALRVDKVQASYCAAPAPDARPAPPVLHTDSFIPRLPAT
jgi:hypothetical protein